MAAENIRRIDFQVGTATSDGTIIPETEENVCVLYNETIISTDEVRKLIVSGAVDYDPRVIYTTKIQADFLKGLTPEQATELEQIESKEKEKGEEEGNNNVKE